MPTIQAHITAVQRDEATGWYRITTDHSDVKRLDTKIEQKARQAAALKKDGSLADIQFTSNPRHDEQTGRTYQNNYYEQAIATQNGTSTDDGIERVVTSRKTEPGDAWRITLSAAAKLAVASLPNLEARGIPTSLTDQQQYALAWAHFLYRTPPPAEHAAQPASDFPAADPGPEPPRNYQDDDIPF